MKVQTGRKADKQYTVRSVPERLDRELRKRARQEDKSLNTVILEILADAVGSREMSAVHHRLDKYSGSWIDDPEFDRAMEEFDRIDGEDWK